MKKLIFSLSVTILVLITLALKLDWRMIWKVIYEVNLTIVLFALLLQSIIIVLLSVRWREFFRNQELSINSYFIFCVTFIGAFFNNLLPSTTGGDAVRGYYIYKKGHGSANAFSPIIVERIVGLMTTLGVAALAVQFVDIPQKWFIRLQFLLPLIFFGATTSIFLINISTFYRPIHHVLKRFENYKIIAVLLRIFEVMHACFKKKNLMVKIGLITLIIHFMAVIVVWLLAISLGSHTSFLSCLVIAPVVFAISGLPITIGGFGLREGAMISLFSLSGMESHHAASLALFFSGIILFASLPGFFFFLSERSREMIGKWDFSYVKRIYSEGANARS